MNKVKNVKKVKKLVSNLSVSIFTRIQFFLTEKAVIFGAMRTLTRKDCCGSTHAEKFIILGPEEEDACKVGRAGLLPRQAGFQFPEHDFQFFQHGGHQQQVKHQMT